MSTLGILLLLNSPIYHAYTIINKYLKNKIEP